MLLTAWALTACGAQDPEAGAPEAEAGFVVDLDSPAPEGSAQPNLGAGPGGEVFLSWQHPGGEGKTALSFSVLDGETWSSPRLVASGRNWMVNWADFPSVRPLSRERLAAHWLVRNGGEPYAYEVRTSVSSDGGLTWSPPRVLHQDASPTEHGFVTLFPWQQKGFAAVWLDGRNMQQGMSVRFAVIASDGQPGPETVLDSRACDCCSTDAAITSAGVVVAYRDRSQSEVRDISVVVHDGRGWSQPVQVAADNWQIPGCPVNGPALAAAGNDVAVAWYSEGGDQGPRVQVAFSGDGGRSFGAPLRLDGGEPSGRVDSAWLPGGDLAVIWMESVGGEGRLLMRRAAPDHLGGTRVIAPVSLARKSGFPKLVSRGEDLIVAWTETSPLRVRTARIEAAALAAE